MKKELLKNLRQLNNYDLLLILLFVLPRWLRHKVANLHPARLLLPIAAIQIIFFIVAVGTAANILQALALGNLIITALALFPITLPRRPKVKAHWIRPYE